jgi:hypothetical protein
VALEAVVLSNGEAVEDVLSTELVVIANFIGSPGLITPMDTWELL